MPVLTSSLKADQKSHQCEEVKERMHFAFCPFFLAPSFSFWALFLKKIFLFRKRGKKVRTQYFKGRKSLLFSPKAL